MEDRLGYEKRWIKPGLEVAHIDNPSLMMRVEEIKRQSKPGTEEGRSTIIVGVKCNWWDVMPGGGKKYNFGVFHTSLLLPWDVAQAGPVAIKEFLSRK